MEAPHAEGSQHHLWALYLAKAPDFLARKQSSQRPERLDLAGPGSGCVGCV